MLFTNIFVFFLVELSNVKPQNIFRVIINLLCAYLLVITRIRTTRTARIIVPAAAEPTIISEKKNKKVFLILLPYKKEDNLNSLSFSH